MEIVENIKKLLQEMIVPELNLIRAENGEIKAILQITNKRLDDVNIHLADLSRRIDNVREELTERIDKTNERIDDVRVETNKRIDRLYEVIDEVKDSLSARIDRLYEVIVRRDEHEELKIRITRIEHEVTEIKEKLAA